jgi:hypothetical protein
MKLTTLNNEKKEKKDTNKRNIQRKRNSREIQ